MVAVGKRNDNKRLDCLKKKSKELSILCDVGVLFICQEDGDSSSAPCIHSWPEDSNVCLSLIDKYKKTAYNCQSSDSVNSSNVLGKRKRRSDDQAISGHNGHRSEGFHMGLESTKRFQRGFAKDLTESESQEFEGNERFHTSFVNDLTESESQEFEGNERLTESEGSETGSLRNICQNIDGVIDVVGYQELQKMMSLLDQATKLADERISYLVGTEKDPFGDSGVDWDELINILLTDQCDFQF